MDPLMQTDSQIVITVNLYSLMTIPKHSMWRKCQREIIHNMPGGMGGTQKFTIIASANPEKIMYIEVLQILSRQILLACYPFLKEVIIVKFNKYSIKKA